MLVIYFTPVSTYVHHYLKQVAAFRATLEEISDSSLLLHVMDVRYSILPFSFSFKRSLSVLRFLLVTDDLKDWGERESALRRCHYSMIFCSKEVDVLEVEPTLVVQLCLEMFRHGFV